MITEVFSTEDLSQEDPNFMYEMFSSIDDFVSLPEGGTPWKVFADTGMDEYIEDSEGFEWTGVRPEFTDEIKQLANKKILIKVICSFRSKRKAKNLFINTISSPLSILPSCIIQFDYRGTC